MAADRPALPYDWSEVRQKLQAALPALLERLNLRHELPRPDPRGVWPRNPMRDDRKPGSFVVWTDGDFAGAWKDYAIQGAPLSKGDVFDLIAGVVGLQSKIDTYWWALDWLGLDRKGATGRPRTVSAVEEERGRRERDRAAAEARQGAIDKAKSQALFKLWLTCKPFVGTPAEAYLRDARRIDLSRLKHPPGAIRWADALEWVDPETGEVMTWRNLMVTAMTRGEKVVALHRTFLKPDGSGKAPVEKPKRMIGPVRGAAIRLAPGPSGLSPSKAASAGRRGPLAIGEGIETALTVAAARPDYRVWAAGSLSLMGLLDWPDCASAVVLLRDNDWKAEAQKAFEAVERHWRIQAKGREVVVVGSAVGSDFNDWVRD